MKKYLKIGLIASVVIGLALTIFIYENYISEQKDTITKLESNLMEIRRANAELEDKVERLKKIPAVVTAYAPFDNQSGMCADGDPSHTSTGQTPSRGIIAVDPARIPYGTRLEIPGYGIVTAGDTGGALRADKDNIRIDVFAESYNEAIGFGKQNIEVIILEEEVK